MTTKQKSRFVCLGRLGWPVELIRGRHITNAILLLLHTREIVRREEWERRQAVYWARAAKHSDERAKNEQSLPD